MRHCLCDCSLQSLAENLFSSSIPASSVHHSWLGSAYFNQSRWFVFKIFNIIITVYFWLKTDEKLELNKRRKVNQLKNQDVYQLKSLEHRQSDSCDCKISRSNRRRPLKNNHFLKQRTSNTSKWGWWWHAPVRESTQRGFKAGYCTIRQNYLSKRCSFKLDKSHT